MRLEDLRPAPGSVKRRKRVGRGPGSGHGKTSTKGQNGSEISRLWNQVLDSGIFRWLAYICILGLIPAHIVWLVEHRSDHGILKHKKYHPGIFEP